LTGVAFPTAISPNNAVAHLSPIEGEPEAETTLKPGDVLKISLGAHIDGFAGILADTIVVPAEEGNEDKITGRKGDVLMAAWLASEVAVRLVKPGNKNFAVTDAVAKVAEAFGCKPLEGSSSRGVPWLMGGLGMLSHQQSRNEIMGKKIIILNPTTDQKNGTDVITFAEGVHSHYSDLSVDCSRKYIRWIFLCRRGPAMLDERRPARPSMPKRNRLTSSNLRVRAP